MACVWLVSPFLLRTFPVATPKLPRSYHKSTPNPPAYFPEPCPYPEATLNVASLALSCITVRMFCILLFGLLW